MADTAHYEGLKRLSLDLGGSLFGVARVESLRERVFSLSPRGIDDLPYAISLGVHLSDRIIDRRYRGWTNSALLLPLSEGEYFPR